MASFYDLDYIIELNEKRLEEYSQAYQKNMDKFTNILVIYSAYMIFLIPMIKVLFFSSGHCHFVHYVSFLIFFLLFGFSIVNTVRLLIPVNIAYLQEPKIYYEEFRLDYETRHTDTATIDNLIKASYINELEQAVTINNAVFKKKGLFYYRALMFAIVAALPYLVCIGFQITNREDDVQKVEIVNKLVNFNESNFMSTDSNKTTSTSSTTTTDTTKLPNVDNSQVRPSQPQLVKENFQNQEKKVDNKGKR